jgi:hypothetical protein
LASVRKPKDVADTRPGRELPEEPTLTTDRWWKQSGKPTSDGLISWVETRRAFLRGYNTLDLIHEAIYEGRPVGRRIATAAMDFLRAQSKASSYLNVLQSMVDTVVSRVAKRRPMPIISCDDAEYSEKLYAESASRILRRKMGQPSIERMMPMFLRDGVVRGDGFVQAVRQGGDVGIEKFPRSELVFDDGEARDGMPLRLARVKRVDRDRLAAQYPDAAARIRKVSQAPRDYWDPYDYDSPIDSDQIEMITGWSLPSYPGAEDGLCVVTIRDGGKPLDEYQWNRTRFPVARIQWTPAMRGFYGIGLIQQLGGSQNKVNELWNDHQEALYWGSGLKVFMQRGSDVNKHHLRARHPIAIEFDGAKPEYIAPNPASTQAMDSLRWLIQQMYEISGISQASASSRSSLGPNASGKALDTMEDIQSDRFSLLESQQAMSRVDIGMVLLDEAKDLADDKDFEGEKASWIREIEWKKFDFDSGGYHLNIEPINFLPDSRAGKLDALGDLGKIPGLLTSPLQTASLFEEPDIAREFRHILGPKRMIEKVMEMLGNEDIPLEDCAPTPEMDPVLALEMAKGTLGDAFSRGAKDAALGRYRWFLQMLDASNSMKNAAPAMPPGAGAPPPDAGMPAPPDMAAMTAPPGITDPMMGATSQLAAGMPLSLPPGALPPGVS